MPLGVVIVTGTMPAACAGVVRVTVVSFITVILVAGVVPKVTLEVPINPVPIIVTKVPPVTGPAFLGRLRLAQVLLQHTYKWQGRLQ